MMRRVLMMVCAAAGVLCFAPLAANAQGPRESIVVRGHWVLEVRNQNGTLAERREFENALTSGRDTLAKVLARKWTMGGWSVYLRGSLTPFRNAQGQPASAVMVETDDNVQGGDASFQNLTVSVEPVTQTFVLKGMATASVAGTIDSVISSTYTCAPTVAPAACTRSALVAGGQFSSTQVKNDAGAYAPLSVAAGQIVQVTVTISFASPPGS